VTFYLIKKRKKTLYIDTNSLVQTLDALKQIEDKEILKTTYYESSMVNKYFNDQNDNIKDRIIEINSMDENELKNWKKSK